MKQFYSLMCVICISILLSACQTTAMVEGSYKPIIIGEDQKPLIAGPVYYKHIIIDTFKDNGKADIVDAIRRKYPNYIILGSSRFTAQSASDYAIYNQADAVGASVAVIFQGWVGSEQTGSIGSMTGMGSSVGLGNSASISNGVAIGGTAVTKADVFEQQIYYLAKYAGKNERIGLEVLDRLPAALQQQLERNKGAFVSQVSRGPAFDANILVGDVVVAVNGEQVIDNESASLMIRNACRKVAAFTISILRGPEGKKRDISIPNCIQ